MPKGVYKRSDAQKRKCAENFGSGMRGKNVSDETKQKISLAQKGRKRGPLSEEWKMKISEGCKGKKPPPISDQTREKMRIAAKYRILKYGHPLKGKTISEETRIKLSRSHKGKKHTEEQKKKIGDSHRGEKNFNWKGGITPINIKIRNSLRYKVWREAIFKRDNWACSWCKIRSGKKKKVYLQVDHIKPFSLFPDLRFDLANGRTLCIECHRKTDTWAGRCKKLISNNNKICQQS